MERFIIDTNFFFNLQENTGFGTKTQDVIVSLTKVALPLKKKGMVEFLMPQSVSEEFLGFFKKTPPYVATLMNLITVKSPDITKLQFPAPVFYKLVREMRRRSYRGLQIGEEQLLMAAQAAAEKGKMDTRRFQETMGPYVAKLRERHRHATRFSFLDSIQDLDLIMLAKETEGFLVSSDEGVLRWGRIFGVKEMPVMLLKDRLSSL